AGPTAAVLIDNTGGGATAGSRLVYFAFDIAAVHRDYATNPTRCLNHRGKIVHDAVCWARTGFVYGQVKDIETDAPIPNIQVNIGTVASGFTMSDGRYEVHGVPPGTYGITIGTPGYFEHPGAGVAVHGGLSDVENFRLTIAPPGSISGFVFQSDGVTPIGAGVTVTAQPLA
ncbi:MAG: carboxypeptidase regulatory-like domain-containing protein, partial [Armatimonadetes bacterium]|nr:carboxypeptidase regulatory-like domain-containing protein [Armatimonadota bacterium]